MTVPRASQAHSGTGAVLSRQACKQDRRTPHARPVVYVRIRIRVRVRVRVRRPSPTSDVRVPSPTSESESDSDSNLGRRPRPRPRPRTSNDGLRPPPHCRKRLRISTTLSIVRASASATTCSSSPGPSAWRIHIAPWCGSTAAALGGGGTTEGSVAAGGELERAAMGAGGTTLAVRPESTRPPPSQPKARPSPSQARAPAAAAAQRSPAYRGSRRSSGTGGAAAPGRTSRDRRPSRLEPRFDCRGPLDAFGVKLVDREQTLVMVLRPEGAGWRRKQAAIDVRGQRLAVNARKLAELLDGVHGAHPTPGARGVLSAAEAEAAAVPARATRRAPHAVA